MGLPQERLQGRDSYVLTNCHMIVNFGQMVPVTFTRPHCKGHGVMAFRRLRTTAWLSPEFIVSAAVPALAGHLLILRRKGDTASCAITRSFPLSTSLFISKLQGTLLLGKFLLPEENWIDLHSFLSDFQTGIVFDEHFPVLFAETDGLNSLPRYALT